MQLASPGGGRFAVAFLTLVLIAGAIVVIVHGTGADERRASAGVRQDPMATFVQLTQIDRQAVSGRRPRQAGFNLQISLSNDDPRLPTRGLFFTLGRAVL